MIEASWGRQLTRVVLSFALAALLGWLSGYMFLALALVSVATLAAWLYQLLRIVQWLRQPDNEPPKATGIWGEIFDGIHYLQRRDRLERDRLQTTVSYLRDSFAALNNATVIIDPGGNIEWSNVAAERLLGLEYPRDQGQALLNLLRIPAFHKYFSGGDYAQALLLDGPHSPELRLLIEITRFGTGSRLLFARDVTREEQLEEMRRDFVADVSHELRTPLTVINGYLLTLLDTDLGEDKRLQRPLQQMQQQAQRMETLLRDLLWLSRLESQRDQVQETTPLDVAELLNEIRQESLNLYPGREVSIDIQSNRPLRGNYQQLHSAFSNLLLNALKYTDGGVGLRWSENQRELQLAVTDQGPGIDAQHIPRLTERFYRVDKSRSVATGGTGLGLAIVKHVLAAHQGHLKVASKLGSGSCFRCIFPLS